MINKIKLLAPDFFTGRVLVTGKMIVDIVALIALYPSRTSLKLIKLILQIKPRFTMVKNRNLINLYNLVKKVNNLRLPGDIVECGVWNGGSAAMMGFAHQEDKDFHPKRSLWLFDSFQGLPPPGERDGSIEQGAYFEGLNKGSLQKVPLAFRKINVSMENTHIVPGWFNKTLSTATVEQIALLHIDADWYESVKLVLDTFYDKIVPGGFIVFDDYGYWEGCNRAVEDFFAERKLHHLIIRRVGRVGAYFQKPL